MKRKDVTKHLLYEQHEDKAKGGDMRGNAKKKNLKKYIVLEQLVLFS
jgi:hypothetical protein